MHRLHISTMPDSVKWAWWTLGVLLLTAGAYGAFFAFLGHRSAITSVFALLALTVVPAYRRNRRRRPLDEREREIAKKALRAGLSALWVAAVGFVLVFGFSKGWDSTVTVPVWIFEEVIWWALALILGVEAGATLVLYAGGSDA
jgi:hypothetical protein